MEALHKAEKTPTMGLQAVTQLPENTNCVACSEDGRYVCLGHSGGLSVYAVSFSDLVTEWQQEGLEITFLQMTNMTEETFLLATVDDMGVARVFALHFGDIHLLRVMNAMEDINQRSICSAFELYIGGHYGAAAVSCNGASWLEVYHFPSAAWLKELETVTSKKQESESNHDLEMNWSAVTIMKIKPPKSPAALDCSRDVLQSQDFQVFSLSLDEIRSSSSQWEEPLINADAGKTKPTNKSPRRCNQHFLQPCGRFSGGIKDDFTAGLPVAVAVWWSGSCNLLQYLLQKATKNKSDVDPMPDWVWPQEREILCSAVSRCTRYIAVGLDDAIVSVWDRLAGAPLCVVLVPAVNSPFFRIQFVDYRLVSSNDSQMFTAEKVHLFVSCKSGEIYTVTTGQGIKSSTLQLSERSEDSRDVPTVITLVPFLQGVLLVVLMNGKIVLQDVINRRTVCFLTPPPTHQITTPCNPVYAFNNKQQTLFIRGDEDVSWSPSPSIGSRSQLFIIHLGGCNIIKQYVVPFLDSPQQQTGFCHATPEETCHLYLQKRAQSVNDRKKNMGQAWEQLQETAAMLQQKQPTKSQLKDFNKYFNTQNFY